VNAIIKLNGQDVTDSCRMNETRIAYDTSRRITTASITVMGQALTKATGARYDTARYDAAVYSVVISQMFPVQILDGRDGVTKLFDGQIYAMTLAQSDAEDFTVFYQCELNDWAAWLDRSVCWNAAVSVPMPNSDQGIITALFTEFCPKIHLADIAAIVPVIQKFDWLTKTCRAVLDELSALSMGTWIVDFDGGLHYQLASTAPPAPFGLSTTPDFVNTFPVKVEGYKQDFTNPVNHAYVRGTQDPTTGVTIAAEYSDPVSIQTYGEYATGVVDDQIVTGWDAALRAKSMVLTNAYPIESGSFAVWGLDGLACGMQVHITEENIGIDGDYIIRALTMQWVDPETVAYTAQFGSAQPDLETVLRLLDQRTRWKTSNVPVTVSTPGPPPPGSVTDASIAPPGLSASSIQSVSASTIIGTIDAGQIGSVNANTIIGQLTADQIGAVNAGSIVGVLSAGQIGSVNASAIQGVITASQIGSVNATAISGQVQANQIAAVNAASITGQIAASQISSVNATSISGSITAGQIGSVNAATINGVVVSSQLADQIIDNLAKYADALKPIQMIRSTDPWPPTMPNKNFPPNSFFYYEPNGNFYQVDPSGTWWQINNNPQATLMDFYYIGAINATSITGLITAAQIGSVNATTIVGQVTAGQIGSVTAGQITGQLSASQIAAVNASSITGQIASTQIATITAGQITGSIQANQIAAVNASVIAGQIAASQIASVNATAIQGAITAGQIASVTAGQITGQITGSQIASISAGQITGSISSGQIGSINAATITIGQLNDTQISGMSGAKLSVGSIASDKFNGYSIDVGGLGNMPGRIRVYDATKVVGQIGVLTEVGYAAYGGWFLVLAAGGTGYANAKLYTDTGGNLFLKDCDLNISGVIKTSATTLDATYSTVCLKAEDSTDRATHLSRGLVFYYNNSKIGALVRSPSGGWMEMELLGGGYVLISGSQGVRSDAGYSVGGTRVINSSGQFTGTVTGPVTGTITGSVNTSGTVNATGGHTGGAFTGSSVNTGGLCTASGFAVSGYGQGTFETVGPIVGNNGVTWYLYFKNGIYYGHTN